MVISVRNLKEELLDSVIDELALEFKQVRKVHGMVRQGSACKRANEPLKEYIMREE